MDDFSQYNFWFADRHIKENPRGKLDNSKKKITQIFRYLKELSIGANPKLDLTSYGWKINFSELENKLGVSIGKNDSLERDSDEPIVKIKKIKETDCPPLPKELDGWIISDVSSLSEYVQVLADKYFVKSMNSAIALRPI